MEAADAATFFAGSGVGAGDVGLRCTKLRYRDVEYRSDRYVVGHHHVGQFSAINDYSSTVDNDSGQRGDFDNSTRPRFRLDNNDGR